MGSSAFCGTDTRRVVETPLGKKCSAARANGAFKFNSDRTVRRREYQALSTRKPPSMTKFSKILAVLATVASVAFLGVVSVVALGGPNYEAEISDPLLSSLTFERKTDDETGKDKWTAQTRLQRPTDPKNPKGDFKIKEVPANEKVLADVVVKAHQFVRNEQIATIRGTQDQNGRKITKGLDDRIDDRKKQIAEAIRLFEIDQEAMKNRIAGLATQLEQLRATLLARNGEIVTLRQEEYQERQKAQRRRDDIRRLSNQFGELQADRLRLITQEQELVDLIDKIKGTITRLERRNRQLRQRTQ